MKRVIFLLIFVLCLCAFTGCGKNQSELILESLQAVETAMRQNVDNPEKLFAELDECIEKYAPVWEASSHLLEHRTKASFKKEFNLQIEDLRTVSQEIVDLDLEIQDRLKDQPELLKAYGERVRRIGAR